ncbi:hypothetical protein CONCODRAFT_169683 [Conidiobolus coronatus NRRL 28638]|uniref:Uncharacterized protein n=1 Tax=Conidiobolus coronatus (strain ATCC 28846 / CBS 209.66 / NRRL 28638) TaxID=796925 RepID=A0A137P9T6_CONC2|nr:hypothetical protein CONCODRAFT_169683 [Conidiobolus coronatus NRRL 28638]|eukprot:KXN71681.1 hypothetical protein CONCODRAFT_169683 [Conidiobolus coronatus NRRL 28638]
MMNLTNIEDLPSSLLLDVSNYLALKDRVKINSANKYLYSCTLPSVWSRIDFTKTPTRDIGEIKKFGNLIRHAVVKDLDFVETQLSELNMIKYLEVNDGIEFLEANFYKLNRLNLARLETIKLTQNSFDMGFSWFSSNQAFSSLSSISVDGSNSLCLELLKVISTSTRIRLTNLKLNLDTLGDGLMDYIISQYSELNSLSLSTKFDTILASSTAVTDNLEDIQGLSLSKANWIELNLNLAYHNENLIDHIPLLNTLLNRTTLPSLTSLNYSEHFTHPNSSTTNPLALHRIPNLKYLSTNISIENTNLTKIDLINLKLISQELNPLTLQKLSSLKTLKRLVINSGGIKSLIPIGESIEASNLLHLELCNHCLSIDELILLLKWTPNLSTLTLSQLSIPAAFNNRYINLQKLTQLNINHQLLANSDYVRTLQRLFTNLKKLWIDLKFSLYPSSVNQFRSEFNDLVFCKE